MEGEPSGVVYLRCLFPHRGEPKHGPFSENFSSTHFGKESKWVCRTKLAVEVSL
jgi:hypothetical protein